jgi:hypothetical protein
MADETTATISNLLYDMQKKLVENFSIRKRLLTEFKRATDQSNFDGLQARVPQLTALKQGTGGLGEAGTVNPARVLTSAKALVAMTRVAHAISITPDLIKASKGGNFAFAGGALKLEMQQAEQAMPRVENEMINGPGNAILATASASTNTTAITIPATSNWYQFYPLRVVDIVTVATGIAIANGTGRVIQSVNKTTGVVTLDAGGGAVNVTSGTHGIGIDGSSGNGIQSVQQAAAITGTFEGIDKAANVFWQGVDGRAGDASAQDLSIAILDGMERQVISSGKSIDFYLSDRAVLDKFGQTLVTQSRWGGADAQLATGWSGIKYRDKVVVPEDDAKTQRCLGVSYDAITMYAYEDGPNWDETDGFLLRRFSRTLPAEAWLVDYIQLGIHQCNCFVFADNLNQAA